MNWLKSRCTIALIFLVSTISVAQTTEDMVAKMKTALAPMFQENQDFTFSDFKSEAAGGGFKLSGTATFFQIQNVVVVGTFSSADLLARFEMNFPHGVKLPGDAQKKLAKQNILGWLPGDIQKLVTLNTIYLELAQNTISTVGIQLGAQQDWNPVTGIAARNIVVDFNLNNPLGQVSISGTLKSDFKIGDATIKVGATLSSNPKDCVLTGDISTLNLGNVLSTIGISKSPEWPDAFWNLSMSKGTIAIAPFAKTFMLNTTTDFGQMEFAIDASKASVEFIVGIAPPSDFSFKRLDPNLGILDNVGLKNTALVLASSNQKTKLNIFNRLGQDPEVTRGLTLLSLYNVSEMSKDVEKLLGKSQLLLRATISNNPSELKLMASLDANIAFDEKRNVILRNVNFAIAPNPASFEVSLGGTMDVKVEPKKTLQFKTRIAINITNVELSMEGIMDGVWDRPFDHNGVQVADLGIGIGISFKAVPLPMPTMQFKGKIKLGNPASPAFAGDVLFALDPSNPTQCMIDGGFKQILMKDLVSMVQYASPGFKVPEDSKNMVNSIAMQDARLTIVPGLTTVTVLEKSYDPGFLIKGKAIIDDYSTSLLVGISTGGIKAGAEISAFTYPPYFSFSGAQGKPNPFFNMVLSTTNPQSSKIAYSGKATLLKLVAESDMMLSDKGFDLYMNGKIYDKFQAKLRVAAGSTKSGAGYNVMATMDSDLHRYISEVASAEIDKATKDSQKSFREAQATLTQKQQEINLLNADIEKQRNIVKGEREKDCEKFDKAADEVRKDKKKVSGLKDDIDDKEDKIKKLAKEIEKDLTKSASNGTKITKLKAEVVTLETALGTAKLGLKASEKILEALGAGCDKTPIDLDPRVSGLIASKETADKSLQAAKLVVQGAGILTVGTLKGTKYIVEKGGAGVVTVNYAYFESKLDVADGGIVVLRVKGTYAGDPMDKSFSINLPSPQATVEAFARELLK